MPTACSTGGGATAAPPGFELFIESDEGMYIWTRHPAIPDSAALLDDTLEKGIMLGPGQLLMVDAFQRSFSTDPRCGICWRRCW